MYDSTTFLLKFDNSCNTLDIPPVVSGFSFLETGAAGGGGAFGASKGPGGAAGAMDLVIIFGVLFGRLISVFNFESNKDIFDFCDIIPTNTMKLSKNSDIIDINM